ncbi:MAG: nucleotide exchange factor GrpE [Chloroflexi bacterium]|nr:nucleotide exchange factor GrpE [Chloroflexota bacterium]
MTTYDPWRRTPIPSPPSPSPDDWKERYLRLQADVASIKKRTQKLYAAEAAQQVQGVIRDLLPVIDNLQTALDHTHEADPNHLQQGVKLTLRAFLSILAQHGVTAIEAQGQPFDPRQHEALGQIVAPEIASGHVAQVLQNGYMIHDRLLRPAKVLVAA